MNLRGPRFHLVPRDLPLVAGISAGCGAEFHGPQSTPSAALKCLEYLAVLILIYVFNPSGSELGEKERTILSP